jgi:hypothetical protein
MRPNRLILPTVLTLWALATGCTTFTRLAAPLTQAATAAFTSATLADLQLIGIKTGPLIPLQANPDTAAPLILGDEARRDLAGTLGTTPVGVLLPITRVGETTPWWIFCPAGELQKRCEEIPPNARVNFTGHPLRGGVLLLPTRLTWSAQ